MFFLYHKLRKDNFFNTNFLVLPASLLSEDVLCPGGHDDDLSLDGGHANLHAAVTILSELSRICCHKFRNNSE